MLKLTMSATFVNAVASSMATVALNVREVSKTHSGLKAQEEKSIIKTAKVLGIPVEEYRADKAKRKLAEAEKFVSNLPFFSNIKEKATKVATLTKTDDEVIISVNEEYLTECVQAAERVTLKLLKPLADIACIFGDEEENQEAFDAKWFPKEDSETTVETKVVPATDVPVDVRSGIIYHGWKLEASDFSSEPFFTDENYENHIVVHFITATKEESTIQVAQGKVKRVLGSTKTLLETAKATELPVSLVKAVRAFYGQEPLVDSAQPE